MQSSKWKSRRQVLELGAAVGLTAAGTVGFFQVAASLRADRRAVPERLDRRPDGARALDDLWLGPADAPVTMIEYASMTCPHCAAFQPILSGAEIEIYRHRQGALHVARIPLRPAGDRGFHAGALRRPRQARSDGRASVRPRKNWAYGDQPLRPDGCRQADRHDPGPVQRLPDATSTLYDQVNAIRDTAANKFGVDATPTFFVNGKKIEGEMSVAELDNLLPPMLKG